MLRGHATARVDAKGRLKVPADFLAEFLELCGEERRVYVTSEDGETALVYPLPVWEEREKVLAGKSDFDPAVQNYLRVTSFWGRESALDKSGRLLVHPLLREAADLDNTVSVFGKQRILEIANFERLKAEKPAVTRSDLESLARYRD